MAWGVSIQDMKSPFRFLKTRIFFLLYVSVGVMFLVFTVIVYHWYRADMTSRIHRDLLNLAHTAALALDATLHEGILQRSSENAGDYIAENEKLRHFRRANSEIKYIYTLALKDGRIVFVLDPTPPGDSDGDGINDHSHIGQFYREGPKKEIMLAFSGKEALARYTDRWGNFITAFVPIIHSGRVVAVLGLDMTQENFARLLKGIFFRMFCILVLGGMVLIGLSYAITSLFMRPIHRLAESFRSVDLEGNKQLPASAMHQELRPFADTINRFLDKIRNELRMREEAERALRLSEQKFRELTDLLPQTIFECDASGRLTFVNRFGFENYGYSPEDMERGISVADLIVPEDRERAARNIADIVIHGKTTGANEYRILRRDGTSVPVLIYSSPILTGDVASGFRGIIIDITERKKAEEDLRQAQKMEILGSLAGGIAHDFNNVLSGILGTISLMRFSVDENKYNYLELPDDLAMLESAALRAADLVKELLTLAKKQELTMVPMDLKEALKRVINICRNTMSKSIEIRIGKAPDSAVTRADINQIEQALLNLSINSSHAIQSAMDTDPRRKGLIEITLEDLDLEETKTALGEIMAPGKYWRIGIRDNGSGMHPGEYRKIFEPFYTTKKSGTGLGLTITKSVIAQHGGYIDINSEPDRGTTFHIYLRNEGSDQTGTVTAENEIALVRGSGRVLVVDDEEMVRTTIVKMLRSCGYTMLSAESGEKALALYGENAGRIDLVLLDRDMPGLTGPETLDALIGIDPGVRVLMMSGYRNEPLGSGPVPGNVAGFIQKPFTLAEINRKLVSVLGKENTCS